MIIAKIIRTAELSGRGGGSSGENSYTGESLPPLFFPVGAVSSNPLRLKIISNKVLKNKTSFFNRIT